MLRSQVRHSIRFSETSRVFGHFLCEADMRMVVFSNQTVVPDPEQT